MTKQLDSRYFTVDVLIPAWATHIAQDSDGSYFWYDEYPVIEGKVWMPVKGGLMVDAYVGDKPKDWTQQVYEIS